MLLLLVRGPSKLTSLCLYLCINCLSKLFSFVVAPNEAVNLRAHPLTINKEYQFQRVYKCILLY